MCYRPKRYTLDQVMGLLGPKTYEAREALALLDPNHSKCVKNVYGWCDGRMIHNLTVECTLPLDVETAIGLQIVGDQAAVESGLELTILASLETAD